MTKTLFDRAQRVMPGGVNSPVRAFKSVPDAGSPIFFKRGEGAYLFDIADKKYIDYVGSWGPMILGHAHPEVTKAVQQAAENSLSFGAPTEIETTMAELLIELMPAIEKVRLVNSGTEAAMSAIRLARGYTKRDKIIKFEGCYHGHADSLLVKAGSGALTLGIPTSPGVPADLAQHTITLTYNDIAQVQQTFADIGEQIAAIIIEPIAGNMNCIPADIEFLQCLRKTCDEYNSILIFDEVMSGFRVALGGAQSLYKIKPDLTILGKVIGGGLPVGAFGGSATIMDHLAPLGAVYQAGTLSGNPITISAGLRSLQLVNTPNFFTQLSEKTKRLVTGIVAAAQEHNIPMSHHQIGGMFGLFFTEESKINSFQQVMQCNQEHFQHFFSAMLTAGVYLAPSSYEAGFVSQAHTMNDIDKTVEHADIIFSRM